MARPSAVRPRLLPQPPACLPEVRFDAATGTLTIANLKGSRVVETAYSLERIGSDWGDGFRLTKHVGHPGDEGGVYDVCLADEGHTCDCLGFLRHAHCKHVAALVTLRLRLEL